MGLAHPKYRADIDGLRAIAVLCIVGFHAFPDWIKGGFIGVDIFFVISGFLISTIIFGSLERGSFSFFDFYSRRIKRIYPALLLLLVICYILGGYVLLPDEYGQLGKHIAGGAGFVSNFVLWDESGYFDTSAETKPLLHLWSLGIEEQFYIIWPPLVWLAWKRKLNLLTITLLVAALSLILNVNKINSDTVAGFYSPQTRFWELLVGSVLAYIALYKKKPFAVFKQALDRGLGAIIYAHPPEADGSTLRNCQSVLGASLIITGALLITEKTRFPGWWAVLPTLGTAFIIAADSQAWVNRIILANRVLVWFGLISFPLYLWHWPLLSFARIVEGERPANEIQIAAVVVSIFLAWLTYQLIEKPIRFGQYGTKTTISLFFALTALGGVGYQCYADNELSLRFKKDTLGNNLINKVAPQVSCDTLFPASENFPKWQTSIYPFSKDWLMGLYLRHILLTPVTQLGGLKCKLSKPDMPSVALIGDSHSGHYYDQLADALGDRSLINIISLQCLPFSSARFQAKNKCKKNYQAALSFLKNQESIKTVYLAGYWSYLASSGRTVGGDGWRFSKPISKNDRISFQKNGQTFIAGLIAAKKDVIILRDIPDLNFNIKSCIRPFSITKKTRMSCAIDATEYKKRVSSSDAMLLALTNKFPTLKVFDPRPLFCDDIFCWAMKNGEVLYTNGDHLTNYGAGLVIKELLSQYPINPVNFDGSH